MEFDYFLGETVFHVTMHRTIASTTIGMPTITTHQNIYNPTTTIPPSLLRLLQPTTPPTCVKDVSAFQSKRLHLNSSPCLKLSNKTIIVPIVTKLDAWESYVTCKGWLQFILDLNCNNTPMTNNKIAFTFIVSLSSNMQCASLA